MSTLSRQVDDRHPQEQGLKLGNRPREIVHAPDVDDRHPQEQGLKPHVQAEAAKRWEASTTVIHKNKD